MYSGLILILMFLSPPKLFYILMRQSWYQDVLFSWYDSVKSNNHRSIAEIGCGPGLLLSYIATFSKSVTGIDKSARMLNFARNYLSATNVTLVEGDVLNPSVFNNQRFDLIVGASILNVIDKRQELISNCLDHLNDGGTLSFFFPTTEMTHLLLQRYSLENHITGFSFALLKTWVTQARKLSIHEVKTSFPNFFHDSLKFCFYLDGMVASVTLSPFELRSKS